MRILLLPISVGRTPIGRVFATHSPESRNGGKSLFDHLVRELLKIQGYDEAKCLWTSQIHRIHPNMPAATMMGIGLMWDFQKRIVHAAVIT